MNTRMPIINPMLCQRRTAICLVILLLVINAGCVPVRSQLSVQSTPTAIVPPPPASPSPAATAKALIPAGWTTYTSQRCEYALGYPADMQVSNEGSYSRSLSFKLANPDEGARNFVYISVIIPEFQNLDGEGIYNYDPKEASLLLDLPVGESRSVRDISNLAEWFTYQRHADTTISGYAAKTYENVKPWEFPSGTKEIRYYLSLDGCTYQIGGYISTTQSNQQGAITEDLYNQIVDTIHLMP